jgi:hypothetical protein
VDEIPIENTSSTDIELGAFGEYYQRIYEQPLEVVTHAGNNTVSSPHDRPMFRHETERLRGVTPVTGLPGWALSRHCVPGWGGD